MRCTAQSGLPLAGHTSVRWSLAVHRLALAGILSVSLAGWRSSAGATTTTPSTTPTPIRTPPVDTEISGIVYDASIGIDAPIADAEIHYNYRAFGALPDIAGSVRSDAEGRYRFVLSLAPGGVIDFGVEAPGFATLLTHVGAPELLAGAPTNFGLAPVRGIVQVAPSVATIDCGGTLDVTVSNIAPPGETLVILRIWADHDFSQGDYGTGFRWDLTAFQRPLLLASGEQLTFQVAFSAAGQQYPSRLRVQVVSGAREGSGTAYYRGQFDGCGPTPTPTATAAPQRTGDLGTRQIRGHVYDLQRGVDAGIAGATVSYVAPSGAGTVQTDDQGAFAFSLFLHDTDSIAVRASATGYHASEVHLTGLQLWYQPTLDVGLEPADSSRHRVTGRVHRDPYCPSGSTVTVTLTPLNSGEAPQSLIVPASDEFAFDDVADGDYSVSAESDCRPSYAPPASVYVRGADTYVEIFFASTCPPVVAIDPTHGPAGTTVELHGRCYYIHSGARADIYFDAQRITAVHGSTSGDYDTEIRIPADARGGWHSIRAIIPNAPFAGTVIGTAGFYVEGGDPVLCAGDCDGDGHVAINELVTGVRIALGFTEVVCAAIDSTGEGDVAIAELVAAVGNALNGCQ